MSNIELIKAQCKTLKLLGFLPIIEQDDVADKSNYAFLSELLMSQSELNAERKISA